MSIKIIKSRYVSYIGGEFQLKISYKYMGFGIEIYKWGLRIKLLLWDICIHY